MRTGEGSSSPSSAWVSQQVFPVHPNWRHLLHWEGFCICLSPLIFTLSTAETTPIGLLPCWLSKLWKPPLPSSKLPKYRTSICQKKWYIIYDKKTTGDYCKFRKKKSKQKVNRTLISRLPCPCIELGFRIGKLNSVKFWEPVFCHEIKECNRHWLLPTNQNNYSVKFWMPI